MQKHIVSTILVILSLQLIQINTQTSITYNYSWNDSTKTITFATTDSGAGTFTGKFLKATPLTSTRMFAGKYREPITTAPHTIDILMFDTTNTPTFIGSFAFQTDVVGTQTISLPSTNPAINVVQDGISAVLVAAIPNAAVLLQALQAKSIQADPRATKAMTVRIFNYSEFVLNAAVGSSSQMTAFTPSAATIPIKSWINLAIQFTPGNSSQQAVLNLTNDDDSTKQFHIRAMIDNTEMKVYVDWGTIASINGLMMSPPPMTGTQNISIGLYEGTVYSLGIFRSDATTPMAAVNPSTWKQDWMSTYSSFLNTQKMMNMKIPGTHNAGSINFAHQTIDYQVKTQTQSLTNQLNSGMRSFDLRVQKVTDPTLAGLLGATLNSYYITHGVFVAGSTATPVQATVPVLVATALGQFKTFSDSHANEVIILNFHLMRDSTQTNIAQQAALISHIETELAGRMIPSAASIYTYGWIIQNYAHPMRLIVSYNDSTVSAGNANFWDGVAQIAPNFDTGIFTRTQIFDHIKQTYDANTYTTFSSAQAAQVRSDIGPMSMYYEAEEFCSRIDVYEKLNICHVDFPEQGFLAEAMISMNGIVSYKAPSSKAILNSTLSLFAVGIISMLLFSSDELW